MRAYAPLLLILTIFFLTPIAVQANPDKTTKMLEAYKFSLGNNITCPAMECDVYSLTFLLPQNVDTQDIQMRIHPECFYYTFNSSDVYNVTIACQDGTYVEYDMKADYCTNNYLTLDLKLNGTGYNSVLGPDTYSSFWCSFRANDINVQAIPTELVVLLDGVGLHSKYITANETQDLGAQANMAGILQNFVNVDMQIWWIIYYVFLIGAIMVAIWVLGGLIPQALKWAIKKVTED